MMAVGDVLPKALPKRSTKSRATGRMGKAITIASQVRLTWVVVGAGM